MTPPATCSSAAGSPAPAALRVTMSDATRFSPCCLAAAPISTRLRSSGALCTNRTQHGRVMIPEPNENIRKRADQLFREHQQAIYRRTDAIFAGLMLLQWAAAIAAA